MNKPAQFDRPLIPAKLSSPASVLYYVDN